MEFQYVITLAAMTDPAYVDELPASMNGTPGFRIKQLRADGAAAERPRWSPPLLPRDWERRDLKTRMWSSSDGESGQWRKVSYTTITTGAGRHARLASRGMAATRLRATNGSHYARETYPHCCH